jgi:hypothetical protein
MNTEIIRDWQKLEWRSKKKEYEREETKEKE